MDFITENYLWFIVGGVIIILAVIGYIAEKTDFGRKAMDTKTPKVKEPKENKKELKAEKKEEQVIVNSDDVTSDLINEMSKDEILPETNELNTLETPDIDDELYAPLTDDVAVEGNSEKWIIDYPEQVVNEVEYVENQPEQDVVEETMEEQPQQGVVEETMENEEEDIWKF